LGLLGLLGLLQQLCLLIASLPHGSELFCSVALLAAGLVLLLADQLQGLLLRRRLHLVPGQVLGEITQRYLQAAPRLLGLLALSGGAGGAEPKKEGSDERVATPQRQEVRQLLVGLSPELAALLTAEDLPEAVCAILEPMNQETKRALAWLRRPDLRLDLVSQLRLYGLAQQATHGNATASTAATEGLRNTAGRACRACRVQTLKSQSWHACHGLHQAEAAKQLVQELAARDPCFGGAGDFDLWHLVRGLLKAKLPKASAASSRMPLPLLAATLAAVWMASRRRHQSFKWCRLMAGILAMLASAAGGAAMFLHGVPASVYAALPVPWLDLAFPTSSQGASRIVEALRRLLPPLSSPLCEGERATVAKRSL